MKKWLILFVGALYLVLPIGSLHSGFGFIPIILSLVSGCVLIAYAVKMQSNPYAETEISMKMIMILKLCLLPVYVVCFMLLVASGIMVLTVWFAIPGLFMIPTVIVYSYFVLFASSSLAISWIIILGRRGVLKIEQCVIHIILQMLFVADVVDSIIISRKGQ